MSTTDIDPDAVTAMASKVSLAAVSFVQLAYGPGADDCGSAVAAQAINDYMVWQRAQLAQATEGIGGAAQGAAAAAAQARTTDADVNSSVG